MNFPASNVSENVNSQPCIRTSFYFSAETYSEPSQTSKMEISTRIVNDIKLLTNYGKRSMLDV